MEHIPWSEKYRPDNFDELISQRNVVNVISKLIENDRLQHMLFYGESGTGKTSAALICAKKLYGDQYKNMIMELNGSDDRGINTVRNKIKKFASAQHFFNKGIKLIILDEADSMTPDAQFALRRIIEKYTCNVRFFIICNYVEKIIPAIRARCMQFRFQPLDKDLIRTKMVEICKIEHIVHTDDGLDAIIKISGRDMRKCYNLLQSIEMVHDIINAKNVYNCTGLPSPDDIDDIIDHLVGEKDFYSVYKYIDRMMVSNGYALVDVLAHVAEELGKPWDESRFDIKAENLILLIKNLASIENRLVITQYNNIQLAAFVAAFFKIR
jgi:replication factor C subunit 3/5